MILIVSAVFPPEPVVSANLSYDIACELAKEFEVTVVSPIPSRPFKQEFKLDSKSISTFKHQVLSSYLCPESKMIGRLRESFSFGKSTSRFIKENFHCIDVIYANTWPLLAQFLLIKSAKKYKIPVVLHVQDIYPESLVAKMPFFIGNIVKLFLIPLDKYILQSVFQVIAISPQMKKYFTEYRNLNSSKITVIRNWQNDESFHKLYSNVYRLKSPFRFMYLGSISPSAGVEMLIMAFAKARLHNCSLVIAGNGSDKESCVKLSRRFDDAKIEFWDAPIDKVAEIQSQANVMLLPLRKGIGKTASPSKLPAYLFSKKPIIACVDSDCDASEIISKADCGWVVEPENIILLAETMIKVSQIADVDLMRKGLNGYQYAMKHLTKRTNLLRVVSVIKSAMNDTVTLG